MKSKLTAFAHQKKSLAHAKTTPVVYDCSDPGCVSADTEFLTPTGWKRIDQYAPGDRVAQFYPDEREVEFVEPLAYIKKPCAEMVHIAPARGTSQRLSPEHRVLYYTPDGKHSVCSAMEFMQHLHQRGANHAGRKFCTTFSLRSESSLPLTDWQIRLMVAVIADGTFGSKSTRCVVRLKKDRKVERMRMLLAKAAVPYHARVCGGDPEFLVFTFEAPRRDKEFTEFWWGASQPQLEAIADELPHWDSSVSNRPSAGVRFSTLSEISAEFAQFAFSAAKHPASVNYQIRNRTAEGRGMSVEYNVHAQADDRMVGPGRKDSVYLAPNPEGFKYCFEVPTSFLLLRHNGYIFATGNTGKTAVAIWDFDYRRTKKKGKCALVLAPRSLLRTTWFNDFKKFAPSLKVSVATAADREDAFFKHAADVYVTNTDAVKWLAKQNKAFFDRFDTLIIDESSAYKHATSQRSKAAAKIAKFFKYRRAMTGTPNGRSITDVWHQVLLLDGGQRLGSSFFSFRNAVCEPRQVGRSAQAINWIDKDGAEEAVFGLLQDIVIRHKFEDCVDIPANHRYTMEYELPPKHRKVYDEFERLQYIELKRMSTKNATAKLLGEKQTDIAEISAINAAVLANKLLQVASGAVYSSADDAVLVDEGRYKMILDLVEERQHSLVFFHWKHQRDALVAEAEKRGITFCTLDGGVCDDERTAMVMAYQAGKFQVMFAHPRSAAHGLTLTKGTTTIWASPTYDLELYEQGSKRQHRMGQTQKTETITIVAPGTVDSRAYDILQSKNARMQNLLDLFAL